MDAVHPDDRDAVRLAVEDSLASGRDFEVEHRVLGGAGQTRWISGRGRIEHNPASKAILLHGVVLDITARRGAELDFQQLQGQLAHTSRVSMLGQLASAIAHELNQPLAAILRNAEAAELFLERDPPDLDEVRAILADIRSDDQRAGAVIERLRALLKRRSIEPRRLLASDLLGDIAALTRADAAGRRIAMKIESGSALPPVMGDAVHLQQVLLNLVLNAMDAIDSTPAAERLISVRADYRDGGLVEVAVSDSGPGIAAEKLEVVFEPFFTTKASGMGIGLSISRTIIEAHGGRIWAQANSPAGAIFRFTLPRADAAGAT
jgi:two-component system, LuxR family, sensor kinase FixL